MAKARGARVGNWQTFYCEYNANEPRRTLGKGCLSEAMVMYHMRITEAVEILGMSWFAKLNLCSQTQRGNKPIQQRPYQKQSSLHLKVQDVFS